MRFERNFDRYTLSLSLNGYACVMKISGGVISLSYSVLEFEMRKVTVTVNTPPTKKKRKDLWRYSIR